MDPKLTILFLLIGAVIALSNLNDEKLAQVRRQIAARRWREFGAGTAQRLVIGALRALQIAPELSQNYSVDPPRKTASAAAVGCPCESLRVSPECSASGALPPLLARTITRIAAASGRG